MPLSLSLETAEKSEEPPDSLREYRPKSQVKTCLINIILTVTKLQNQCLSHPQA